MLRISKKADYAVFLLGRLARHGAYPGGPAPETLLSAQEMARASGLNKSVVANLLKELAKDGVLDSVRGLKGGYRLAAAPGDISLARILRVVQGPFHLVECVQGADDPPAAGGRRCSLLGICPSSSPMHMVHERIAELFHQIRLDELCGLTAPQIASPLLAGAGR